MESSSTPAADELPDEEEQLLRTVNTFKHVAAACIGAVWGILGFTGIGAIVAFVLVVTGAAFFYVTKVLELDDDDFGRWALVQEGWQCIASFTLVWIFFFNLVWV